MTPSGQSWDVDTGSISTEHISTNHLLSGLNISVSGNILSLAPTFTNTQMYMRGIVSYY